MISIIVASTALYTQELPYAQKDLIFQSPEAVEQACVQFASGIDTALESFIQLSRESHYKEAYQTWSDLLFNYHSFRLRLGQATRLSPNQKVKESVESEGSRLEIIFQKKLQDNPALFNTFLHNAKETALLTPQQRFFTESILKEYQETQEKEALQIAALLEQLSKQRKESFSSVKGQAPFLNPDTLSELNVLSANILCFPGDLTYTYGGASPWKERIDKLTKAIIDTKAEIVCLQEVWDPAAMCALVERLQNDYAFFLYDGGDPAGTLRTQKMGYNSGLFIASKLELDSVSFRRFPRSIPPGSNRGAFLATCRIAKERISFINTHLQHGNTLEMREVRQEQLFLCYASLQEIVSRTLPNRSWGFLAGDLNVNAFSTEFSDSGISRLFTIPYTADLTKAEPTCTEYFNDLVMTPPDQRAKVVPTYELLDYCIAPTCQSVPSPTQTLLPLYNIKAPTEALSDHNGLLTTWKIAPAS